MAMTKMTKQQNLRLLLLVIAYRTLLLLPVFAADLSSDTQALLSFYNALTLARRVKWNASVNACTWIGVGCGRNQDRVRSLRLPAAGLYGEISPSSIGLLSELRVLSLRSNRLSGLLPLDIANCTQLRAIYLHHNSFLGPLPSFRPSNHLLRVDLSFNRFNGSIPEAFNGFPKLRTLYLQNNSLSGNLPKLNVSNLVQFSVANNKLNGSIPSGLQRFDFSAFAGNQFCGQPYFRPCPSIRPSPMPSPSKRPTASTSKKLSRIYIVVIIIAAASFLFCFGILLLFWCWRIRVSNDADIAEKQDNEFGKGDDLKDDYGFVEQPDHNNLIFLENSPFKFHLEDLLRASAEVLGKGSMGTSYKAVLEDGPTVVVKRLKDIAVGRKDFEQQMDLIGRMDHGNLVPLRAYYYSKDEKLLVRDYVPMASLDALLHGTKSSGSSPLDWDSRLKIALSAAHGVAYIHEHGGSKFSHGDIKSSNILLNGDYDAYLSDFGLGPLFSSTSVVTRIAGYLAPEVAETRKMTHKSDTYSFGVLLLELLTGKAPMQTSTEEGVDLPRWVQSVVREEWTAEVFDVELMRYQNIEEEMVQMLQIGMACVATMPDTRPNMTQVVTMIEDVRQFETDDRQI